MVETPDKLNFSVPERAPLEGDEPRTLVEIYERVVRDHPKPDNLNYKHDGEWQAVSAKEMMRKIGRASCRERV